MTESFLVKIWGALLGLLLVSVAIGFMASSRLANVLIFSVATIKAALVGAYYMGIKNEPRYILYMLLFGVMLLGILFFLLAPDVVGSHWSRV